MLGDHIPRKEIDQEGFCHLMLLLFKPWRSFFNLRAQGQSWSDVFEQTAFSACNKNLINNMNIDSKCRDAKVSHSEMLRSGMITQTNGELCTEVIASDGNDLLSTLADELATTMEDDLSGVFNDNDSDEHAH